LSRAVAKYAVLWRKRHKKFDRKSATLREQRREAMPTAEILSKQAIHTLTQLHGEIAGKIETNRKSGDKLRAQMVQVEAVIKMLAPERCWPRTLALPPSPPSGATLATRGSSAALYIGQLWTAEAGCGANDGKRYLPSLVGRQNA
jgi:hypothetical protein